MPALDRALALDERQHGAVLIAEQLHLDVPRLHDPPLEVHGGIAERRTGFGSRGAHRAGEVRGSATVRMPLPPPPATAFTSSG